MKNSFSTPETILPHVHPWNNFQGRPTKAEMMGDNTKVLEEIHYEDARILMHVSRVCLSDSWVKVKDGAPESLDEVECVTPADWHQLLSTCDICHKL